MCYHKASSPLPVSDSGQIIGNLFEVAAHRDCPFHPGKTRIVTVALIVRLLCPVVNRCVVPMQSGLSSVTKKVATAMPLFDYALCIIGKRKKIANNFKKNSKKDFLSCVKLFDFLHLGHRNGWKGIECHVFCGFLG